MSQVQNNSNKAIAKTNDNTTESLNVASSVNEVSEIVRDVGATVAKEIVATLPNMLRSLLGQPLPMDYDPKKSGERQAEEVYWKNRYMMSEAAMQQEKSRTIEKQQAQIARVDQIREYMKTVLTPSVATFAKEIDNTLLTAKATADIYTEHFLMEMLSMLLKINKKISKASMWMASARARSSKKGPFFMTGKNMQVDSYMSGERAVSFGG